jgi:hypothetical protein
MGAKVVHVEAGPQGKVRRFWKVRKVELTGFMDWKSVCEAQRGVQVTQGWRLEHQDRAAIT